VLKGDANNDLFRLFGDGDGDVDEEDLEAFLAVLNVPEAYNAAYDSDGDGDVDDDDLLYFQQRYGLMLP